MPTVISINLKTLINQPLATNVSFTLVGLLTSEGASIVLGTTASVPTDVNGLGTVNLSSGNYVVKVLNKTWTIGVSGTGTANLIDLVDITIPTVVPKALPTGGSAGQVLSKIDTVDYNVQWTPAQNLSGLMVKASNLSDVVNITTARTNLGLGSVDNTTDLGKPVSTATQTALNLKQNTLGFTAENIANKNQISGYAGLDATGKINPLQLPATAIVDTFVVASQAAMLALDAQTGDVAIRTDLSKSFILQGSDPTILANWQELLTPTDLVGSVFGRNGVVTAQSGDYNTSQVTENTNLYFTLARVRDTVLAGVNIALAGVINGGDTVLGGLGKAQAQISANITNIALKANLASPSFTGNVALSGNIISSGTTTLQLLSMVQTNLVGNYSFTGGGGEEEVPGLRITLPIINRTCRIKVTHKVYTQSPAGDNDYRVRFGTSLAFLSNTVIDGLYIGGAKTIETLSGFVITNQSLATQSYINYSLFNPVTRAGAILSASGARSTIIVEIYA